MFAARPAPVATPATSKVEQKLATADLDHMSPREAMEFVYQLAALLDREQG